MRFLWILLLLLAGCASSLHTYNPFTNQYGAALRWQPEDFPLRIEVDRELSPAREWALEEAVVYWNMRIGKTVFTIDRSMTYAEYRQEQGTIYVASWNLPDYDTNNHPRPGYITVGQTFPDASPDGRIRSMCVGIDLAARAEDATLILEHELGHALGLGHAPDTNSIMYPYVNETLGNVDLDDFRFIRWEMTHNVSERNFTVPPPYASVSGPPSYCI